MSEIIIANGVFASFLFYNGKDEMKIRVSQLVNFYTVGALSAGIFVRRVLAEKVAGISDGQR